LELAGTPQDRIRPPLAEDRQRLAAGPARLVDFPELQERHR
jgi:hypothetical protein